MDKQLFEIIKGNEELSRRDFVDLGRETVKDTAKSIIAYNAAKLGLSMTAFLHAAGCVAQRKQTIEQALDGNNYRKMSKDWDPVFGPSLLITTTYGGKNDFKGHLSHPVGRRSPGVDYDVSHGTLLVPATSGFLHSIKNSDIGGLVTNLSSYMDVYYKSIYSHLSDNIIDEKYYHGGEKTQRLIKRNEIISLSGNSGRGPKDYGGIQPEHLHFSLYFWDKQDKKSKFQDPEKYGPDGGKPIFWDGETNLDRTFYKRVDALEKTIKNLERELESWPKGNHNLEELRGNISEYGKYLRDADWITILDSKYFNDMKDLLKREILDKSKETKHIPGTKPYSLMLKILGYSVAEEQKVVLTLPFISPELVSKYKEPVYEQGEFLHVKSWQGGK